MIRSILTYLHTGRPIFGVFFWHIFWLFLAYFLEYFLACTSLLFGLLTIPFQFTFI